MTRKTYSIFSSSWLVALESPLGKGEYTPSATQLRQMVMRMSHSNGFHSTMLIHSFRRGFFRVIQKRALAGLSDSLFKGFRIARRTGRFRVTRAPGVWIPGTTCLAEPLVSIDGLFNTFTDPIILALARDPTVGFATLASMQVTFNWSIIIIIRCSNIASSLNRC